MSANTIQYEKGTIKVVWVENSIQEIHSRMFEDEKAAADFAKGKQDYIIFSLIKQQKMETFSWKILPYGNYRIYLMLLRNYYRFRGNVLRVLKKIV